MSFSKLIDDFAGSVAGFPARSFTNEKHPNSARLTAASVAGSQPLQNAILASSLGWALVFTDALLKRLDGSTSEVIISAWHGYKASGLFLHDVRQDKAVRVGSNDSAGCGRVFWGKTEDFEFETYRPAWSIIHKNCIDFELDEMSAAIETVYQFLTKDDSHA